MRHGRARRGGNRRRAPRGDTALLGHGVASLTRRARREARKPAARTRAVCCSSPSPFGAKPCQRRPVTSFAPRFSTFRHSVSGNRARLPDSPPPSQASFFARGGDSIPLPLATGYTAGRTARQDRGARFARSPTGSTPPSQSSPPRSRPHRPSATPKKHSPRIRRRYTLQAAVAFRVSVGEHLHGGLEEEGRVRQARHDIRQG